MISMIVLSAGLSSRFGSPKALAPFGPEDKVITRILKTLLKTKIHEIIVVLGAQAEEIKPYLGDHPKIQVVINTDFILGQTSSFKVGLKAVNPKSQAIGLWPVDYPAINPQTIDAMGDHFLKSHPKPSILIPVYDGHKGHPPLFAVDLKDKFLRLPDSQGINSIFPQYSHQIEFLPVHDQGIILSFNTQNELVKIAEKVFPRH